MSTLVQAFRHAVRSLLRRPAYAGLVVLTLGLGIGADATIFAVARGMLFAPFPYQEPASLVTVSSRWEGFPKTWVAADEARTYRQQAPSLADLGLYFPQAVSLTGGDQAERVRATVGSANLLTILGAEPVLGRSFRVDEDVTAAHVVLLGNELWQRRFGGRNDVLGSRIEVDGEAYEVIGVLPAGLSLP
jgi:putative ABC transport system permease protein